MAWAWASSSDVGRSYSRAMWPSVRSCGLLMISPWGTAMPLSRRGALDACRFAGAATALLDRFSSPLPALQLVAELLERAIMFQLAVRSRCIGTWRETEKSKGKIKPKPSIWPDQQHGGWNGISRSGVD